MDYYRADVSDSLQVKRLFDYIKTKYNRLDILFNNAGCFITENLTEISDESFDKTYKTNVNSVLYMTRTFIGLMEENNGVILNNASIAGMQNHIAGSKTYMYASSKAAVIQFSQICALNYAGKVRVNCICPGVIDTPLFTNRDFSRFDGTIPIGRIGSPEDIAKAALFLCSSDSNYITGVVLPVDGGASLK